MSVLGSAMMVGAGSVPFLNGISLWLDGSDFSTMTLVYTNLGQTVSGVISTNTLVANSSVALALAAGNKIKVNGADVYTVASIVTTTITTVESLTANYSLGTSISIGQTSQWNDKSGRGNNVTQGTANAQPQYAANSLNGKSVLTFGGDDSLVVPSGLYSIPNGNNTTFIVSFATSNTTQQTVFDMLQATNNAYELRMNCDGAQNAVGFCNVNSAVTTNWVKVTSGSVAAYRIYTVFRNGTTASLSINNAAATTNTNATSSTADSAAIGSTGDGGLKLTGGVAEMLVYNRALSASEIVQVNRYLSQKWSITIS